MDSWKHGSAIPLDKQMLMAFGASAAIIGGCLRVISTFIPYTPDSPWLELLYAAVDILMLFGLMTVYGSSAKILGWTGLAGFVLAAASLASIVGPDPDRFGINFYQAGAAGLLAGLATLSTALLRHRRLPLAASLWFAAFASTLIGVLSSVFLFLVIAGLLLGLGFAAAGVQINSSLASPARARQ